MKKDGNIGIPINTGHITLLFISGLLILLTAFIKIKPSTSNNSNTDERPNILFIFTDDQRAGTIHAPGNKEIHTPAMDSLVRQGTTFTNACIMGSQSGAVCAPSRAMIMTGRQIFSIDPEGNTNHFFLCIRTFNGVYVTTTGN